MIARLRTIAFIAAMAFCMPAAAAAQNRSVDSLLRRIDSLEHKVSDLELRLRALETRIGAGQVQYPPIPTTPSQARPVPNASKWRDLANWRQLRRGMSEKQVRDLLGEPERVQGGSVTSWRWDGAEVYFMDNKLAGWSEP